MKPDLEPLFRAELLPCSVCRGEIDYDAIYGMRDSLMVVDDRPVHYACSQALV